METGLTGLVPVLFRAVDVDRHRLLCLQPQEVLALRLVLRTKMGLYFFRTIFGFLSDLIFNKFL